MNKDNDVINCPRCSGKGYVYLEDEPIERGDQSLYIADVTCKECMGDGWVYARYKGENNDTN